jgi:hypothetical protein
MGRVIVVVVGKDRPMWGLVELPQINEKGNR